MKPYIDTPNAEAMGLWVGGFEFWWRGGPVGWRNASDRAPAPTPLTRRPSICGEVAS